MKLRELLKNTECAVFGDENVEISGVEFDSREVAAGDLFFCIRGFVTDGHKFAPQAVAAGAVCLMVSERLDLPVTQVVVRDDRAAMAEIAAAFYGYPSEKLDMVGVTGTNGKTTTTYMIKTILEHAGRRTGLIGTIQNMIGDLPLHTERTTPESPDLQALIGEMVREKVDAVCMEVSSHSLSLKRVHSIGFKVGIFTNLTRDHLDFHGSFENYAEAKRMLCLCSESMAINADDEYAEYMAEACRGRVLTYGINKGDMRAGDIVITPAGTTFTLSYGGVSQPVSVHIAGQFTVYNAMSAIAACMLMGLDMAECAKGLSMLRGVAGRFESLPTRTLPVTVILDYAHTPDSLENVLNTARGMASGRVVCIVGCGGNRDATKRPLMGEIAGRLADFTVITSDNPRFEKPMDIIGQIVPGIERTGGSYTVIENRREAIKYALQKYEKDDIIVLAGKGHEDYQEICGVKHPFDERVVVAELLDELGYREN